MPIHHEAQLLQSPPQVPRIKRQPPQPLRPLSPIPLSPDLTGERTVSKDDRHARDDLSEHDGRSRFAVDVGRGALAEGGDEGVRTGEVAACGAESCCKGVRTVRDEEEKGEGGEGRRSNPHLDRKSVV